MIKQLSNPPKVLIKQNILPYYEHVIVLHSGGFAEIPKSTLGDIIDWIIKSEMRLGYDYAVMPYEYSGRKPVSIFAFHQPNHAFDFKIRWVGAE